VSPSVNKEEWTEEEDQVRVRARGSTPEAALLYP
jgi:hypothetical protein